MFGVILVSIGTFFEEVSSSIGKRKVNDHKESPYIMAFLSLFWATIFFALISLIKNSAFVFSFDSLPTFVVRIVLEIVQVYVSIFAIIKADRTTYSFIRTITIPLLLLVDLILGYKIGLFPIVGIAIIAIVIFVIFLKHGLKKKGSGFAIFSAINAVITISLFKYDITHFNSVAAEQLLISLILLICFSLISLVKTKENPFIYLTKPIFFLQSISMGLGGVVQSFGYSFGAASIIVAAKRSSAIFWSILSGKVYFKEKHIILKFFIFVFLLIGLFFLSF